MNPIVGMADDNDAAGDREGPTDVKSWRIGQTFLVGNGKDRFYKRPVRCDPTLPRLRRRAISTSATPGGTGTTPASSP
ncbi:MAG: hypothetical protein ABI611_19365 [Solirubrobacteraceae bacterium]